MSERDSIQYHIDLARKGLVRQWLMEPSSIPTPANMTKEEIKAELDSIEEHIKHCRDRYLS